MLRLLSSLAFVASSSALVVGALPSGVASRVGSPHMVEITKGVEFDTIAREYV
jgi:hypothetical protein